jgi:non-heme chloroperoxidase
MQHRKPFHVSADVTTQLPTDFDPGRRDLLVSAAAAAAAIALRQRPNPIFNPGEHPMSSSTFTTKDGTQIFYKDWGAGQPVVFHQAAALVGRLGRADAVFLANGYRVIAHDRRGHGRSSQTATATTWTLRRRRRAARRALDLRDAIHIGHSTGGGEVARYVARTARAASPRPC